MESNLYKFCLRLADTSFILSYRLGEYVSHGPFLEEDLSITNVGLDLIGQAESLFKYAAEIKGGNVTDDDIAYKREESEYLNFHLVEYPNEDFAFITVRQFFMDVYNYYLFTALKNSSDPTIAAVAAKSIKEVNYHLKRSRKWMLRLGDGTEESHNKIQYAVNELWKYTDELFDMDVIHRSLIDEGVAFDLKEVEKNWIKEVEDTLSEATVSKPEHIKHSLVYGKNGGHTDFMGYILTDLQYLTNRYPDATW